MRPLVRRHRFTVFYGLSLAIVIGVVSLRALLDAHEMLPRLFEFLERHELYANIYSIGRFGLEDGRAFLIFVFAGAPTLAAIAVSVWCDGAAGLRRLMTRFLPWRAGVTRAEGLIAYAWIFGIYLAGVGAYLGVTVRYAEPAALERSLTLLGGSPLAIVFWLAVGPFIDEGGTCEELGWRGYGLPLLFDRMKSPLRATLLLGLLWWLWHFPREIPNILASDNLARWAFFQGVFVLTCLALSIVISYFWFRTGGSVWPAILIHGFTNVWSKAIGVPVNAAAGNQDVRTWVVVAGALGVVVLTRGRLGSRAHVDPSR